MWVIFPGRHLINLEIMEILITGGCGFIGSNFVRCILKGKEDVSVINIDKLTYAGKPIKNTTANSMEKE